MRSIERTLLAWILGALTLGAMVIALVTYLVALEEMHEVLDADLKNVAEAVASYHHAGPGSGGKDVIVSPRRNDTPEDDEIVTLIWTPQGQRVFASDPRVQLPFTHTEGLSRPSVQGEAWIVYSSVSDDGVAQAAQRSSARREMAGESAARGVPPLIALIIAVGGLLAFGLRRGLQPLDGTAQDVAQRSARSLEPITLGDVPKEIKPLVVSINDLMNRLAVAFATQRRLLADAAHELRTPITALRLQLQLLQRSGDDEERGQAVAELAAGIDRSQRLVEQLLQVARSDPDGEFTRREPVDLAELVRATVSALSIKADHEGLDLAADAQGKVTVQGDLNQLTVLLNNLVENALRYTPAGGVVDVAAGLQDGRPLLRVVDNGPGIAESERSGCSTASTDLELRKAKRATAAEAAWVWPSCGLSRSGMGRRSVWPRPRPGTAWRCGSCSLPHEPGEPASRCHLRTHGAWLSTAVQVAAWPRTGRPFPASKMRPTCSKPTLG